MRIRVTLSGPLREYYKSNRSAKNEFIEMPQGANVSDLLAGYGIPPQKVHLVIVNRRKAAVHDLLNDGDHLWLIPLAAGG